jgi:hypothetical protein
MDNYNEVLYIAINQYRREDEKDRKSKKLSKTRSDIEAIELRKYFDTFYVNITNQLTNSLRSNFGRLPDSPLASTFINEIDWSRYHDFLDLHLVLLHALVKLLDYQTNSRGNNTDIAKICNLFAFTAYPHVMGDSKKFTIDQTKIEFVRAYQALFKGLKYLNILEAPLSKIGVKTSRFLYWFIYDCNIGDLNLNILIDLAEATNGSFDDFKSFMVAYWDIRKTSSNTSVEFFYREILPNIK